MTPLATCHEIKTWAGVAPCAFAIDWTTSSCICGAPVEPSGEYDSTRMPLSFDHCGSTGVCVRITVCSLSFPIPLGSETTRFVRTLTSSGCAQCKLSSTWLANGLILACRERQDRQDSTRGVNF